MTAAEKKYQEIGASLTESDGATISQMFGMPSLKIKGKAFAGFYEEMMVFKLTGEPHKQALAEKGAKLFEPMAGRPMKEWVLVPYTSSKTWAGLTNDALGYVSKLKK